MHFVAIGAVRSDMCSGWAERMGKKIKAGREGSGESMFVSENETDDEVTMVKEKERE